MDRYSVVQSIRQVGSDFGRVMACVQSEEFVAGYEQAVRDMVRMFEYKPALPAGRRVGKKIVLFGGARGRWRHEGS